MQKRYETVEFLLRDLPDPQGARLALERIEKDNPRHYQQLNKQPALLADVVALAAWSPLLSTTIEQNPEYLSWLARERANPRIRTRDELKESLARFALTNSSLNPQILLARFRRRELLRTYLHDIRRSSRARLAGSRTACPVPLRARQSHPRVISLTRQALN